MTRHKEGDAVLAAWSSLPRRHYLDTSTLQTIYDYGAVLFDGEDFEPDEHSRRVRNLTAEVRALQAILAVNVRAAFEFAVTEPALQEVVERGRAGYSRWVLDVMEVWSARSAGDGFAASSDPFQRPAFGMISLKDRALLRDALSHRCDAFITMERRLPTAAAFVEEQTGLRILRPSDYWRLLEPWAALYS